MWFVHNMELYKHKVIETIITVMSLYKSNKLAHLCFAYTKQYFTRNFERNQVCLYDN